MKTLMRARANFLCNVWDNTIISTSVTSATIIGSFYLNWLHLHLHLILIHLICIWFNWLIRRREWVCLGVPGGEQDQEVYRCGGDDSDTVRYIPRVQEEEVQGIPHCTAWSLCAFRRNVRVFIRLSERGTKLWTCNSWIYNFGVKTK